MSNKQRAAKLIDKARATGLDGPTEQMIADAFDDVRHNAFVSCMNLLDKADYKQASMRIYHSIREMEGEV